MNKLQKLLNEHKDKLGYHMIVDDVARQYKKVILLDFQVDGISQTFSLNDLIFGTPFLSWLKWREINRSEGNNIQLQELCLVHDSDYHKVNLVLLDTDKARI